MQMAVEKIANTAGALAIAALFWTAPVQATVATPVSGAMILHAFTILGTGPVTDSQLSTDAWTGTPTDLAVAASANSASGGLHVTASGTAAARWLSADQGDITFSRYTWDYDADPYSSDISMVSLCGKWCAAPPDWSYTFTANVNGGIRIIYDIVGHVNPVMQGWQAFWSGRGWGDVALVGADGVHMTGTFAHPIWAGQTYTYSIYNMAGGWGGLASGGASMDGRFSWNITTQGVPEPATWVAMLAGFGCVGIMMRRAGRIQRAILFSA